MTVSRGWTKDDDHNVRATFSTLDDDRTGEIDIDQFLTLILGLGFGKLSRTELQQKIQMAKRRLFLSLKGDDQLTVDLVVEVLKQLPPEPKRRIDHQRISDNVFQLLDQGEKGFISEQDLQQLSEEMGDPQSLEQIRAMMVPFDSEKDGTWNTDDLSKLMS